jgi:hypothetical protein
MKATMSLTTRFQSLFDGRDDAWGADSGGAMRGEPDFASHLFGGAPIGIYPVRGDNTCAWGCVDLDVRSPGHKSYDYESTEDALDAAADLIQVLEYSDIQAWAEITRSGGVHVWVFAQEWMDAAVMRRALLVACNVGRVPTTEVNPKQETLADGQLGNYVRLPYPGAGNNGLVVRFMVENNEAIELHEFLDRVQPAPVSAFEALAKLYVPPRHVIDIPEFEPPEMDEALRRRMSGLAWTIFRDGPLENQDRSGALFRLAALLHEDDLSPEEIYTIVAAADKAWGKYSQRPNGDHLLRKLVEDAYRG